MCIRTQLTKKSEEKASDADPIKPVYVGEFPEVVRDEQANVLRSHIPGNVSHYGLFLFLILLALTVNLQVMHLYLVEWTRRRAFPGSFAEIDSLSGVTYHLHLQKIVLFFNFL